MIDSSTLNPHHGWNQKAVISLELAPDCDIIIGVVDDGPFLQESCMPPARGQVTKTPAAISPSTDIRFTRD
jgi:hypothetical protein